MAGKTKIIINDKKLQKLLDNTVKKPTRKWTIQDGVEYGVYVELGTSRMAARPALVPAFEQVVNQEFKDALKPAIEQGEPLDPVLAKAAFDIQRLYAENVPVLTGALKNSIKVLGSTTIVSRTKHQ